MVVLCPPISVLRAIQLIASAKGWYDSEVLREITDLKGQ